MILAGPCSKTNALVSNPFQKSALLMQLLGAQEIEKPIIIFSDKVVEVNTKRIMQCIYYLATW